MCLPQIVPFRTLTAITDRKTNPKRYTLLCRCARGRTKGIRGERDSNGGHLTRILSPPPRHQIISPAAPACRHACNATGRGASPAGSRRRAVGLPWPTASLPWLARNISGLVFKLLLLRLARPHLSEAKKSGRSTPSSTAGARGMFSLAVDRCDRIED
jgi:hypothetical protein